MAENEQQATDRVFQLQRVYVKDLSFESPNAPTVFTGQWQPQHELNINTKINKLSDESYEVVLSVTVTTKTGEHTAFIVEVHQAGVVGVRGFPEAELGPLLGAYVPNVLFPYAREVVTDLVVKGSFPQLVLQPVNFDALFAQHRQQMAEKAEGEAGTAPH
jgi:preprotein translocase subunit SecB